MNNHPQVGAASITLAGLTWCRLCPTLNACILWGMPNRGLDTALCYATLPLQMIFSLQTLQPTPLLPPLWRLCAPAWRTEPPALRPLQPQHVSSLSSSGLAQLLEGARDRCSAPQSLGLDPQAAEEVPLLQAFMWFLTLHEALSQRWQLSWHR